LARCGERRHKFGAADLGFGEFDGCANVAEFEILHEFVIAGESARGAREPAGVVPVEESADFAPIVGALDDSVADPEQRGWFGVPEARGGKTPSGLEVEIKAGGVDIFATVREAHGDVGLVWTLIGGESGVAVDAEQGTAGGAGIGDEVGSDLVEWGSKFGDELQCGLVGTGLVFVFVRLEPLAVVVAPEAAEEAEQVGGEVPGHGSLRYGERAGK